MNTARVRPRKVMLLGEVAVGKTSLANRLAFGAFQTDYKATIGVNLFTYDFMRDGSAERFVLWDTDGEFGGSIFDTVYVRGAAAALVLCDAARPQTWDTMQQLMAEFAEAMPGRPCLGVINKTDLVAEAPEWAQFGDRVVRTSALTGAGVDEACIMLARDIERRGL